MAPLFPFAGPVPRDPLAWDGEVGGDVHVHVLLVHHGPGLQSGGSAADLVRSGAESVRFKLHCDKCIVIVIST